MTPPDRPLPDLPATRTALPMALLRAREAVMRRFRPMLDAHGVNEQQWRVLRVLAEAGPLDASDVAERANILAPSLTRMIRAMTDRALIATARDGRDARRLILQLAPAGEALLRLALPEQQRIYAEIEAQFGAERLAALIAMLDEMAEGRD